MRISTSHTGRRRVAGTENGWSESVRVNDVQGSVAFVPPALVVDPQGNAYAAWIDGRAGHASVYFAYRLPDIERGRHGSVEREHASQR